MRFLWSVVRAQRFEQFGRLVRDGVHQTLAVLLHVIFSLDQSKNLQLSFLYNLLLDLAQHASTNHSIVSSFSANQEGKPTKWRFELRHFSRPLLRLFCS